MRWLTGKDLAMYEKVLHTLADSTARVALLQSEVNDLNERLKAMRKDWEYERERADKAVDSLLQSKGLPPVMPEGPIPPEEPDAFRPDEEARQAWLKAHGLTDAGKINT